MNFHLPDLGDCLCGDVRFIGLGSADHGDDAAGLRLAEAVHDRLAGSPAAARVEVVLAGTTPEAHLTRLLAPGCDQVVFLDAVRFGADPGSAVLLPAAAMRALAPQISTHRLGLGTLAQLIERDGRCRAWLLGIQPVHVEAHATLSPVVAQAVAHLTRILVDRLQRPAAGRGPAHTEARSR